MYANEFLCCTSSWHAMKGCVVRVKIFGPHSTKHIPCDTRPVQVGYLLCDSRLLKLFSMLALFPIPETAPSLQEQRVRRRASQDSRHEEAMETEGGSGDKGSINADRYNKIQCMCCIYVCVTVVPVI